jgi:hypothetical protein
MKVTKAEKDVVPKRQVVNVNKEAKVVDKKEEK